MKKKRPPCARRETRGEGGGRRESAHAEGPGSDGGIAVQGQGINVQKT